jgi:uncharacterized protein YcfL
MKNCVIGIVLLALAGCVTSRSPDFVCNDSQSKSMEKKSIAYEIQCTTSYQKEFDEAQSSVQGQGAWVQPHTKEESIVHFKTVFKDLSSSISPIDPRKESADIVVSINLQNSWNSQVVAAAFLHGLSLYCIPCWGDDIYYLKATVKNKKGVQKEYLIKRNISTTSWLPFIVVTPFGELPITARNKVVEANWKELRFKMAADGFFDKSDK